MIVEERKEALLRSMDRLEAYQQIQNQMGRAAAALNFHQEDVVLGLFALDLDDVSLEYADEGVFEGEDAVRAALHELLGGPQRPGEMIDLQLTTPMIEVAEDVRTAKCVWWCPGAGALVDDDGAHAIWAWGQVAADFVRGSDGAWKIWHLHYFRLIKCSYEEGWVEDLSMVNRPNVPMHPLSQPSTYHNPYTPLSIRDGIPCAPRPYGSYTDADRHWELSRDKR